MQNNRFFNDCILNSNNSNDSNALNNNNTNSARPLLTFKEVWVYHKHPIIDESSLLSPHKKRSKSWLAAIKGRLIKKSPTVKSSSITKELPNKSSFDKKALINAATGTLLSGQVTVLTGHSGSGKSVLLRVLAGLSPLAAGDIYYQNSSIHDTSPIQWRAQIALLAQQPQLLEGSVLDNLQLPYTLQAYRQDHFDIDWHVDQLVQLDRPADFLQQSALHLSGGERQIVNTLRLLQLNPKVLLLDEPTSALDADTSAKLVQLLINWLHAKPQHTLLWVTHDTQDILSIADKHWHMQAGVLTDIT